MIDRFGDPDPASRWRRRRALVHADVLDRGFDRERSSFTQRYGATPVDAALLQLALLGFLADDPRLAGTIEAIGRDLDDSGVLLRYQAQSPGRSNGNPAGGRESGALAVLNGLGYDPSGVVSEIRIEGYSPNQKHQDQTATTRRPN